MLTNDRSFSENLQNFLPYQDLSPGNSFVGDFLLPVLRDTE